MKSNKSKIILTVNAIGLAIFVALTQCQSKDAATPAVAPVETKPVVAEKAPEAVAPKAAEPAAKPAPATAQPKPVEKKEKPAPPAGSPPEHRPIF